MTLQQNNQHRNSNRSHHNLVNQFPLTASPIVFYSLHKLHLCSEFLSGLQYKVKARWSPCFQTEKGGCVMMCLLKSGIFQLPQRHHLHCESWDSLTARLLQWTVSIWRKKKIQNRIPSITAVSMTMCPTPPKTHH